MTIAVVFDCDGVLVDSEPISWLAWRQVLGPFGVEITEGDESALTGRTDSDAYRCFAARAQLAAEEEILRLVDEVTFDLFDRQLQPFKDTAGAAVRLTELGVPIAVASSSRRLRLDRMLRAARLDGLFTVSVAGDEVDRAKPAPDLYLGAAALLGVEAGSCVAVEDTPTGISSAREAGMTVVAVLRGRYQPADLAGADLVVERVSAEALLG